MMKKWPIVSLAGAVLLSGCAAFQGMDEGTQRTAVGAVHGAALGAALTGEAAPAVAGAAVGAVAADAIGDRMKSSEQARFGGITREISGAGAGAVPDRHIVVGELSHGDLNATLVPRSSPPPAELRARK
jgi:hypothetical protein